LSIKEEYEQALREYKIAVQQEQLVDADFMEIAIKKTNAARLKLESVIQKAKKLNLTVNPFETCTILHSRARDYIRNGR